MRAAVERFAWRMWRGEGGMGAGVVRGLLLPAEGVWRLATRVHNRRFDLSGGATIPGLRVVSVGNLAVGGTGKTPFAAWVAGALRELGARPGILARGYGDDEVRLHRRWNPETPVHVGADRVECARQARSAGLDAAVLDDGFQHRRLGRALDIVLLSAEDPVPAPVLPRGPYREPPEALRRADIVVVTRRSVDRGGAERLAAELRASRLVLDGAATAGVCLAVDDVVPLDRWLDGIEPDDDVDPDRPVPSDGERGHEALEAARDAEGALTLTSIARPEAFLADVSALTRRHVELVAHSAHHEFTLDDVQTAVRQADGRPIFMTEKDAVKLAQHAEVLAPAWVVRQRLVWDWGEDDVRRRLSAVFGASEPTAGGGREVPVRGEEAPTRGEDAGSVGTGEEAG